MDKEKRETIVLEKSGPAANFLFENTKFVLKAMGKDATRRFTIGLYGDGEGTILATDGHRMHIWRDTAPCWKGFYRATVTARVITLVPDDNTQVPEWTRVIPQYDTPILEGENFDRCFRQGHSGSVFRLYQKGISIQLSFLKDLGDHDWTIYGDGSERAAHFKNNHLEAVIMPFRPTK